jgi:hypothetical protein
MQNFCIDYSHSNLSFQINEEQDQTNKSFSYTISKSQIITRTKSDMEEFQSERSYDILPIVSHCTLYCVTSYRKDRYD